MYVFSGWRSCWHAHTCVFLARFLSCMYMERAFMYSCRGLRWVLPQRKLLSASLVVLIVWACVCLHLCVQLCAYLCSLVCADENRVAVLHLKGTVINEMNKRPWQQLDNTDEIKNHMHINTHKNIIWELGDFLMPRKKNNNKSAKQP